MRVGRFVTLLVVLMGIAMMLAACSALADSGTATVSINWNEVVYGLLGLLVALVGAWSKRQDRAIADAQATGNRALNRANRANLQIAVIQARLGMHALPDPEEE